MKTQLGQKKPSLPKIKQEERTNKQLKNDVNLFGKIKDADYKKKEILERELPQSNRHSIIRENKSGYHQKNVQLEQLKRPPSRPPSRKLNTINESSELSDTESLIEDNIKMPTHVNKLPPISSSLEEKLMSRKKN